MAKHLPLNTFNSDNLIPLCNTEDNEPEFVLNINDVDCVECLYAELEYVNNPDGQWIGSLQYL